MLSWAGIPGGYEWLVILVVAILIFGRRVPETIGNIGKAIGQSRAGVKEGRDNGEGK